MTSRLVRFWMVVLSAAAFGTVSVVPAGAGPQAPATSVAPVISTQPDVDVVPAAGYPATFTAAATGDPAPGVSWQVSTSRTGTWRTLQGETNTTLKFGATDNNLGHAYRAVFTNSAGTTTSRPAKLVSRMDWMRDLGSDISNVPLTELTIPGSHDMGTYTLPGDDESADYQATACNVVTDSVCDSYSRAQSRPATTELNDGIRYFDLRICGNGTLPTNVYPPDFATMSTNPVACHGLVGAQLSDILTQTRDWVREHPTEVVFLDFNHHFQIDQYMEGLQIEAALTYADGRSMLIPPQYCTPGDPNSGTCAGGLTMADVGPDRLGNIIVNFENDGSPGKTVLDALNRPYDIQPILRYDFYDHHPLFWGRTDDPPYTGKYCTTAAAFASCFGNTDTDADALNSDRNTTATRQTFAEPHPAYTFQHFFVQFLQTTPDGSYMVGHLTGSLLDMAMRSNPVVGPGFFGCGSFGISDCFAQYRPENVNIVALNFYERTFHVGGSTSEFLFDFVHEVIRFDEYARTAPIVTITPQAAPTANGWYNAAALGGVGAALPVSVTAADYRYSTGITGLNCLDNGTTVPVSVNLPTEFSSATGSASLGDGIHQVDCRATDGATDGTHEVGNTGAGPGSTQLPLRIAVDTTPPTIHCPTTKLTWNQPVTSLTATVSDAVSGPTVKTLAMPVSTSTIGQRTVALTATDKAGNTASVSCAYTVSYVVALDYDATQPITVGQPVPIVVSLQDYKGKTTTRLSVTANYVIGVAPCPPGTINCTHPHMSPKRSGSNTSTVFDALATGGFEYDLATTGTSLASPKPAPLYAPGPYALVFHAGLDPAIHEAPFIIAGPAPKIRPN